MRLDLGHFVCPLVFSSTGPGGGDGTLGAATLSILPLPACKSLIQKGSGRVLLSHDQPGKPGRTLCRVRDCLANHLLRGWVGRGTTCRSGFSRELLACPHRNEIGRASCRERGCQYV